MHFRSSLHCNFTQRRGVVCYRRFRTTCQSYLQGSSSQSGSLFPTFRDNPSAPSSRWLEVGPIYEMKTNWCHYFIRILLDLYMFRAHRPIFRRVCTAAHTTIGSFRSAIPQTGMFPKVSHPQALLGSLVSISWKFQYTKIVSEFFINF